MTNEVLDMFIKRGPVSESILREYKKEITWQYVLMHQKLSDDFIFEMMNSGCITIYPITLYQHMSNKLILKLIDQIVTYDDKYQVEYSYRYFPPIWENVFKNKQNKRSKEFDQNIIDRYVLGRTYKYIRKSELKYVPKELAGIWDC